MSNTPTPAALNAATEIFNAGWRPADRMVYNGMCRDLAHHIDEVTELPRLLAENRAMRELLQRWKGIIDTGDTMEPWAHDFVAETTALLESAPCQFCGEPIPHHDPECATGKEPDA